MVEFCDNCKSSLPFADLTIYKGEVHMSNGYTCPYCGQRALAKSDAGADEIEEVVIRNGKVSQITS